MFKKRITISSLIISIVILSLNILSCGSPDGNDNDQPFSGEGERFDLIDRISESTSAEKRIEAINEVVQQGRSLGLLDANGNQLNTNVSDDAISLTPEDIASFSTFVEIGHYSTVGGVIDYLAEVGVVLSETGAVINPTDFLPDLQDYVDWSFRNGDDPDSQLGIMLGSGPEMVLLADPPEMQTSTQISPMAAVMMLGDILIGTEDNGEKPSAGLFTKVAHAADVKGVAMKIQGLITKIESGLKPTNATISFFGKVGEKYGILEKGTTDNFNIKVPDVVKQIIGAFAVSSHFAVRLYAFKPGTLKTKDMSYLKSFEIDQINEAQAIIPALVLVSGDRSAPVTVVEDEIPIMYTIRLLSPYEPGVGTDLYPDANGVIDPYEIIASTTANGHIMDVASNNEPFGGMFTVTATKLKNKERRIAFLHASANILTGDLSKLFDKYTEQYGSVISALKLKPADLAEMFSALKAAVKISPWVTEVILIGGKQVSIDPETANGKPDEGIHFAAKIDNMPEGSCWVWQAWGTKQGGEQWNDDRLTELAVSDNTWVYFPEPGEYWVEVALMDGDPDLSDSRVIDSATAKVTIKSEPTDTPEVELSIEVNQPPPYEGGCSYLFTAKPSVENEQLPENIRWEWYWGDKGEDTRKGQPHANRLEHMISHTFDKHGNFTISVKLFDDSNNTLLATADMPINIDNLGAIQRTKWARAMVYCGLTEDISKNRDGEWVVISGDRQSFGWIGKDSHNQGGLVWKGNEFSVNWTSVHETQTTTYTITGKVSPDATMVETITAKEDFIDTNTNWTRKMVLTLTNVPITKYNCGPDVRYTCYLREVDSIKPYITHYEYESKTPEQITKFTGFAWDFEVDTPKLEVELNAME